MLNNIFYYEIQLLPKVKMPDGIDLEESDSTQLLEWRKKLGKYYSERVQVLFSWKFLNLIISPVFSILFLVYFNPILLILGVISIAIHFLLKRQIRLFCLGAVMTQFFIDGKLEIEYNISGMPDLVNSEKKYA